jgi:type VI secretion system protein ImpA
MNAKVKRAAPLKAVPGVVAPIEPEDDWLKPIDADQPCGIDLEYDPEFVVLTARVAAKMDAQYGDFIGAAEPINWSEVDRDCRQMMMRSKDIRIAVLYTRCRTRLVGAKGLAEGLGILASWLGAFPDQIHPQTGVDEDRDAALEIRMNALQALTDSEGLLSDVREIPLARSGLARLQVRDVERAFAQPRASDALTVESVTRQLEDLRVQQAETLTAFDAARSTLDDIDAWNRAHLGVYTADLSALSRVLRRLTDVAATANRPAESLEAEKEADLLLHDLATHVGLHMQSNAGELQDSTAQVRPQPEGRNGALESMRSARLWFEQHEPSSPIPLLLRRAESLIGRSYVEVVEAIPADLIAKWSAEA